MALFWFLASVSLTACYQLDDDEPAPVPFDGGTIDVSRDAGQPSGVTPAPDGGSPSLPPPDDAGPDPVRIVSFTADETTVAFLQSTTLRWNTENASSCAIEPGIGSVDLPSGARVVEAGAPDETVRYTLTCTGAPAAVSSTVLVKTALLERVGDYEITSLSALSGLAGVNVVSGDLKIHDVTGLSDLSVLEALVRVDGNMAVYRNSALVQLDLPYLEEIGGYLYISENFVLPPSEISGLVAQLNASGGGIGGPVLDAYNDPAVVLDSLSEVLWCNPENASYQGLLSLFSDGSASLYFAGGPYLGSYDRSGDNLRLDLLSTNTGAVFSSVATYTELEYDLISAVSMTSLGECYVASLPGRGVVTSASYQCPSSSGVEIALEPDGIAWWSRPAQQATVRGAYVIDGEWVAFAFPPDPGVPSRFPIARRSTDGGRLDLLDVSASATPCLRE
ncbi:MAG: hypothetical protein ACO3JL_01880 [Myxococcota bacterium]